MLKAKIGELSIFGLSRENVRRLIAGHPIVFDGAQLGLPGRFAIVFGETEQAIGEQILSGLHGPETKEPRQ